LTRKHLLPLAIALFVFQARTAEKFALTVDNIMRGPGLVGYEPAQVRWAYDSSRLYFQWKQAGDKLEAPPDTYTVNRDGTDLRKLSDREAKDAPPVFGADTSADRRLTVYTRDGDIFVYDNTSGKTRQITKTAEAETNPHFLPDGKRIYYTRSGNLYLMSLETGYLEQLTDIHAAAAPGAPAAGAGFGGGGRGGRGGRGGAPPTSSAAASGSSEAPPASASQDALKREQKELFDIVRERANLRDEEEAKRKQEASRKPFNLQARQIVTSLQLSPDEKYVIASVTDSVTAKPTIVPNWVTDSAYVEDITGRPNVGDAQSRSRLAVIDVATGEVKWVDHGQGQRDVQMFQTVWSDDGSKAFINARAADNKDEWLLALDPATGKTRILSHDHDEAWVKGAGPGIPGLTAAPGWMKDNRDVYFVSERTGFAQLYSVNWDAGEPRPLTQGKWEVLGVRLSSDKSRFYITGSKDTPYENHLYFMNADGGPLTRITSQPGRHITTISPDDRWVADIYSYTNKPPDLYAQENRPEAEWKRLTTSPTPEFSQYAWLDVPIVEFTARDGVKVPARLFKPANARKGGPGIVFVHGSGYLQNVDRWWSNNYYREYMFDHILMERGFTVIDVDYRGSAGYGRDWRTAIYEHMGGKDLDDIVDAARYLASAQGVDPKKIGLFGGSYGGFITLMAMFTQPDVFAAGAALRPVSDWALYNHGYTSDILNTPQSDPDAYRRSSPIYFAQGLKGALLICHGMVDTNVEFADTVRLVQRLIELRKSNWDLAVYPVENHGFVQPSSWADEYKRILALFEKNLR
jgi:dipeptidyl aminopeptidase/acylaminoacyl peptidase